MKASQSYRISPENVSKIKKLAKKAELSEGWIVNQALGIYFEKLGTLNPAMQWAANDKP